ncbi:hypothetical protein [Streptomyces sp. Amel2xC10]|uniref:hypothetical protein n=1 Tax=Streptomyces sp. Amel2xC10 TaxID=1305826 RepID=UPI000A083010|nr:hypothetical protein [Streptomyces sp. Amel2xC10]SMF64669.1 hypothetical protein SAMN02745830_05034 [Streptomyces sp. Amel2xC10]
MSAILDLNRVIPATPAAVHRALRTAMPGTYTPELADRIAADIVARFEELRSSAVQSGGVR